MLRLSTVFLLRTTPRLPKTGRASMRWRGSCSFRGFRSRAFISPLTAQAGVAPLSDQRPSSYTTYRQFVILDLWLRRFSPKSFHPVSPIKFLRLPFTSPVYSWIEMLNFRLGFLHWVL